MTTEVAARLYEAQHLYEMQGRKRAIYNPLNKSLEELPFIYGFNNGGSPGWYSAVAISADGHELGGHCCSSETYMEGDLGILEGTRNDRHEDDYKKHYPDGYQMYFIPTKDLRLHQGLKEALENNKLLKENQE